MDGQSAGRIRGDDATVTGLARILGRYFNTRQARRYPAGEGDPPSRLVYLLDHEYTARGLSWSRLKGADASRATLLGAAAHRAGCDVVLALADIQETWDAYESPAEYGSRTWRDDDEYDGDGSGEYELQDLIESSTRLTRWVDPAGWAEDISLVVDDDDVCATTSSEDMQPYESQHEG